GALDILLNPFSGKSKSALAQPGQQPQAFVPTAERPTVSKPSGSAPWSPGESRSAMASGHGKSKNAITEAALASDQLGNRMMGVWNQIVTETKIVFDMGRKAFKDLTEVGAVEAGKLIKANAAQVRKVSQDAARESQLFMNAAR